MDLDFEWLKDLGKSAVSAVKKLDSDDWGNIANVVGTVGKYESAKAQQEQFDEMMKFKLDDYNRQVATQDTAQNNLNSSLNSVFGKQKVDCSLDPLHPDCVQE